MLVFDVPHFVRDDEGQLIVGLDGFHQAARDINVAVRRAERVQCIFVQVAEAIVNMVPGRVGDQRRGDPFDPGEGFGIVIGVVTGATLLGS